MRYDGRDKHFATAVPAGEARFVMNRKTGEIRMARGPLMLLPNPVDEVIVRRILSDRECQTWYPGNEEALTYNRQLKALADAAPTTRAGVVSEGDYQRANRVQQQRGGKAPLPASQAVAMDASAVSRDLPAMLGDVVERGSSYTQPRTIVFNTKFEGVPNINVWVGYAVMVVDKKGHRRVEVGPRNLLLEYDETLEILELSTGRPKSTDRLLRTSFLRVLNNRVGDTCEVETADHVRISLEYSLRVNFTGEPDKWFEVENYVKLLCDHVRSVLKGQIKKLPVETFYKQAVDIVRDGILGKATEGAPRPGMRFAENGMVVTDVEVLEVGIDDDRIATLLSQAQHEAVESSITLLRAERSLEVTRQQEGIARSMAEARTATQTRLAELEIEQAKGKLAVSLAALAGEVQQHQRRQEANAAKVAAIAVEHEAQLLREKATHEQRQALSRVDQELKLAALKAEVDAVVARFEAAQGGFSEALLALSHEETLVKVAEALSVQQIVGGRNFVEVVDKMFAGTPLAGVLERIKGNDEA